MADNKRGIFKGLEVEIGGQKYTIPPLSLNGIIRMQELQDKLNGEDANSSEVFEAFCEIIFLAMRRNYPDITLEKIGDLVDLENLKPITEAVLKGSGMTIKNFQLPAVENH